MIGAKLAPRNKVTGAHAPIASEPANPFADEGSSTAEATGALPDAEPKVPLTTAPQHMPPPKAVDTPPPTAGPTPACPQCESPMAWVEEHLRFYCKSCRMYF